MRAGNGHLRPDAETPRRLQGGREAGRSVGAARGYASATSLLTLPSASETSGLDAEFKERVTK